MLGMIYNNDLNSSGTDLHRIELTENFSSAINDDPKVQPIYPDGEVITIHTEKPFVCPGMWAEPNHALYQVAHILILLGMLAPSSMRGFLVLHGMCVVGMSLK